MGAVAAPTVLPAAAHIAGIRTRLVTKLTGLSISQVRYWHESGLLEASLRAGSRGIPRLYSWVDYLRVQVASELEGHSVPTPRIRRAVEFLDENLPAWYVLPIRVQPDARLHVRARLSDDSNFLADRAGQFGLSWPAELATYAGETVRALATIRKRGPLCLLSAFDDAISMNPTMNLAQPTLVGTALETQFVTGVTREIGVGDTAAMYQLDPRLVRRAVEFEGAVA